MAADQRDPSGMITTDARPGMPRARRSARSARRSCLSRRASSGGGLVVGPAGGLGGRLGVSGGETVGEAVGEMSGEGLGVGETVGDGEAVAVGDGVGAVGVAIGGVGAGVEPAVGATAAGEGVMSGAGGAEMQAVRSSDSRTSSGRRGRSDVICEFQACDVAFIGRRWRRCVTVH
jgi:hypothetical protein